MRVPVRLILHLTFWGLAIVEYSYRFVGERGLARSACIWPGVWTEPNNFRRFSNRRICEIDTNPDLLPMRPAACEHAQRSSVPAMHM